MNTDLEPDEVYVVAPVESSFPEKGALIIPLTELSVKLAGAC